MEEGKRGRIEYSPELASLICERLVSRDGTGKLRALRIICRDDADMPGETTVYKWLGLHDEFAKQYARTREILAEMNAGDIIHIADTEDDPNKARIRIDARKWWASKVAPKVYGDKTTVEGNPDNPVAVATKIELVIVDHDDKG